MLQQHSGHVGKLLKDSFETRAPQDEALVSVS